MAVCATACARVRDGAQLPPSSPLMSETEIPASETFHRACLEACSNVPNDGEISFDLMRTEAVLGMLCLQHNDVRGSHRHLHRYLGMSAEIGFHSESRWGSDLTAIEVEERRRLVSSPWFGHVDNLPVLAPVPSRCSAGGDLWIFHPASRGSV